MSSSAAWCGTISPNFTRLLSDSRYIGGWLLLFQYSAMCLALQIASACSWLSC